MRLSWEMMKDRSKRPSRQLTRTVGQRDDGDFFMWLLTGNESCSGEVLLGRRKASLQQRQCVHGQQSAIGGETRLARLADSGSKRRVRPRCYF